MSFLFCPTIRRTVAAHGSAAPGLRFSRDLPIPRIKKAYSSSLKALAFTITFHRYPQKVSSLDATTAYSAAICALRRQLAAESQPFNAELAASIMCLSLAEVKYFIPEGYRIGTNQEVIHI